MAETVTPQGVLGVAPLLDVAAGRAARGRRAWSPCSTRSTTRATPAPCSARPTPRAPMRSSSPRARPTRTAASACGPSAGSLWHLPVVSGTAGAGRRSRCSARGLQVLATTGGGATTTSTTWPTPGLGRTDGLGLRHRGPRPAGGGARCRRPPGPDPDPRAGRVAQPRRRRRGVPVRLGARRAINRLSPLGRDPFVSGGQRTRTRREVRVRRHGPTTTCPTACSSPTTRAASSSLNPAAERMLATTADAAVGRDWREVLPLVDEQGRDWWACTDPYDGLATRTRQPERRLLAAATAAACSSPRRTSAARRPGAGAARPGAARRPRPGAHRPQPRRPRLDRRARAALAADQREGLHRHAAGQVGPLHRRAEEAHARDRQRRRRPRHPAAHRAAGRQPHRRRPAGDAHAGRRRAERAVRKAVAGRVAGGEARGAVRRAGARAACPRSGPTPTSSTRWSATSSRTRCGTAPARSRVSVRP